MVRIPTNGPPTHPGEMLLEEFLKPLGMSQAELAGKLGVSYPPINELIHGKRGVTPDMALRLEQLLGMEAQFWLVSCPRERIRTNLDVVVNVCIVISSDSYIQKISDSACRIN